MWGCEMAPATLEAYIAVSHHLMSRVEEIMGQRCRKGTLARFLFFELC
jgi:hypothetical protein